MKKTIFIILTLLLALLIPMTVQADEWPYTTATSNVTGSGTALGLTKWLSGYTVGTSSVYDNGTWVYSAEKLWIGGNAIVDSTLKAGNTTVGTLTAGATGVTGGLTADNLTQTSYATLHAVTNTGGLTTDNITSTYYNGTAVAGAVAMTTGTQTLTNKTLTAPTTTAITNTGGLSTDNITQSSYATLHAVTNTGGMTTDNLSVTSVLAITSTSRVANLNADLLDGYEASQLTSDNMTGVVEVLTFKIVADNYTDGKIYAGIKGDLEVPYACTINRVTVLLDATDNMTISIWKDTYANFPPTASDNITPGITVSAAAKAQDTTINGTAITAGDILRFYISSTENLTSRATISLKVTR